MPRNCVKLVTTVGGHLELNSTCQPWRRIRSSGPLFLRFTGFATKTSRHLPSNPHNNTSPLLWCTMSVMCKAKRMYVLCGWYVSMGEAALNSCYLQNQACYFRVALQDRTVTRRDVQCSVGINLPCISLATRNNPCCISHVWDHHVFPIFTMYNSTGNTIFNFQLYLPQRHSYRTHNMRRGYSRKDNKENRKGNNVIKLRKLTW